MIVGMLRCWGTDSLSIHAIIWFRLNELLNSTLDISLIHDIAFGVFKTSGTVWRREMLLANQISSLGSLQPCFQKGKIDGKRATSILLRPTGN